jgi:3-deoxy-D-arabino-heptulosonate 7-phosphate (DAHP) synthase
MKSTMKKLIAFAVLAFAVAAGTATAIMTVHPQQAAATCQTPQCVAPAGFGDLH